MRIISGRWKGKRLTAPKNLPTRPTTDFAKEALFNILNHRFFISEVKVLDLFAGIGSISFEFCSRGAEQVTSVERNHKCVQFISNTSDELEFNQLQVIKTDVFSFLKKNGQAYDLIFADPPFDTPHDKYLEMLTLVFENKWLDENGMLILEHGREHSFDEHPYFLEHKKYSNLNFSFFEFPEEE